ncbi:PREDICTED: allergen Bos d 2-like [Chinchilla lanigera]|uniref:allergen Bos d 2-like n=1 Tax=Chinchilla lanigera TaxID=34839 RepID=UPI00038ED668|nr:PREDICTED: allergen Bos d 2-like [Chinchilla lanigera]
MAADNVMAIEEDGLRRAYFRAVHCDNGCETIRFRFYVKLNGKCKLFVTNASGGGAYGMYTADVPGSNIFKIIYKSSNFMVIYAIYMEGEHSLDHTRLTLALGTGRSMSEEEREKYEELTALCNISPQNIRYLTEADTCPD